MTIAVYANYIGPSVMTDANSERFPICDERITENDRCVIKIIGIHCYRDLDSSAVEILQSFVRHRSDRIPDFVGPNKILSDQTFYKAYC